MVEDFKRGGEFSFNLGQDLVAHSARVLDGVEPVVPGHLFLGYVRLSHGTGCGPCTFGQPFGRLAPGGGTNDLVLRVIYTAAIITPQGFLVAVAAELLGEISGIGAKLFEGLNDALVHERLHAVEPDVIGSTVDEDDGVAVTQISDGVAKYNVQVDLVEVVVGGSEGFSEGLLA